MKLTHGGFTKNKIIYLHGQYSGYGLITISAKTAIEIYKKDANADKFNTNPDPNPNNAKDYTGCILCIYRVMLWFARLEKLVLDIIAT